MMTPIEEQLREIYNKIVWTHKIQEKSADINFANHKNIKLLQIIISAITAGTLIGALFGKSGTGTIISALFATLSFGLQAYTKDLDFSQKANQHAKSANALRGIREDYLSLLIDLHSISMSHQEIAERRDQLKIRLDEILETAPRTGDLAYERAAKALNVNKDHTFTVSELDQFLPAGLRSKEGRDTPTTT
jgi:hypothetical protein